MEYSLFREPLNSALDEGRSQWLELAKPSYPVAACHNFMLTTIPATRAKNNFGELIRRVYTTGDRVIVEKDGIPVVLISRVPDLDLRRKARNQKDIQPDRKKTIVSS